MLLTALGQKVEILLSGKGLRVDLHKALFSDVAAHEKTADEGILPNPPFSTPKRSRNDHSVRNGTYYASFILRR